MIGRRMPDFRLKSRKGLSQISDIEEQFVIEKLTPKRGWEMGLGVTAK